MGFCTEARVRCRRRLQRQWAPSTACVAVHIQDLRAGEPCPSSSPITTHRQQRSDHPSQGLLTTRKIRNVALCCLSMQTGVIHNLLGPIVSSREAPMFASFVGSRDVRPELVTAQACFHCCHFIEDHSDSPGNAARQKPMELAAARRHTNELTVRTGTSMTGRVPGNFPGSSPSSFRLSTCSLGSVV